MAGEPISRAQAGMLMIHGRGARAEDILFLANEFNVPGFACLAPQAAGNTWYPNRFLVPLADNEPWLSSALKFVGDVLDETINAGISAERIILLGFSQGACLALEFATRNAQKWGGVVAFTGGLIGDRIYTENYTGDFGGTKVFIGNSDKDPHVPLTRTEESRRVMEERGARVTLKIYPNMPHTMNENEIEMVNEMFFR